LIVGLGAGWNKPEFEFLGADFETRGKRLDEYIRVLRELWTSPSPSFEGRYVKFADALFSPRSPQPNGPPIWIGGGSPAAIRRAATLADGWHSNNVATPSQFGDVMHRIREQANGRHVEGTLRVRTAVGAELPETRGADGTLQPRLCGSAEQIVTRIKEYQAAGLSHLVAQFRTSSQETYLEDMRRFAQEVRPALQAE
jgi:alkanesulfonate monooxygenase SsuD/methylene tetrahydromethanopterin reductase-like flavin-dependent oxidoreductase (luciferase family)